MNRALQETRDETFEKRSNLYPYYCCSFGPGAVTVMSSGVPDWPTLTRKERIMSIPTYLPPQQQPGQARRRFWMILGIVASLIVLVGLIFTALVATDVIVGLNAFFNTTTEPTPVAANYYLALMTQDYAKAYADLDSHATINGQQVDQQTFITLATTADTQNGKVSGYSLDPSLQSSDPSHPTITVHRGARIYQVHLQLQQEGTVWKIINADGI